MNLNNTLIVKLLGKCQCCLSDLGVALRSMKQSFHFEGRRETYWSMLTGCFLLEFICSKENLMICEKCILRLKEGCAFKNQVLQAQQIIKEHLCGDSKIYMDHGKTLQTCDLFSRESSSVGNTSMQQINYKKNENAVFKSSLQTKHPRILSIESFTSQDITAKSNIPSKMTNKVSSNDNCIKFIKIDSEPENLNLKIKNEPGAELERIPLKFVNSTNVYLGKIVTREERLARRRILEKLQLDKDRPYNINKTDRCCPVCKEKFNGYNLLISHMSVHYPNYVCSQCGKPFSTLRQLKTHQNLHHRNPFMLCKMCGKKIKKSNMLVHIRTHNNEDDPYCCSICPMRFETFTLKFNHIAEVHKGELQAEVDRKPCIEESINSTPGESKRILSKDERVAHRRALEKLRRDKEIPYKIKKTERCCPVCKEEFRGHKILLSHMPIHYPKFVCSQCGRPFATQAAFRGHQKQHLNNPQVPCKVCGKEVKKCNMQRHLSIHTGAAHIHCCPSCPERFKTYAMRQNHITEFHNGESHSYKCKLCPKAFRLKTPLTEHVRKIHLKEKKHSCSECGKLFFKKWTLNEHMRRHTGDSFKCSICFKGYVRKTNLNMHMRVHHPEINHGITKKQVHPS